MFTPAARVTDPHVCAMVTVLVPHVGGPILPPCATTTFIGGLPAARVTDLAFCAGGPDVIVTGAWTVLIEGLVAARVMDTTAHGGTIVMGCMTCLIGDSGAGGGGAGMGGGTGNSYSGSPQAATMSKARADGKAFVQTNCAAKSATQPLANSPLMKSGDPKKKSWIEIVLVDDAKQPVAYEHYRVTTPEGDVREGFLDEKGFARVDGIDPGNCKVTFPQRDKGSWEPT